jgi:uncharacterized protein
LLRPLPSERKTVLIAAVSGRALAAAARRAGFVPLVADFFADADTASLAHACDRLEDLRQGFVWPALKAALGRHAEKAPAPVLGVVCGSGFEDRPALLAKLAQHWPVLGNEADTVAQVKAPEVFFRMLDQLGIPHPATALDRIEAGPDWLVKRIGGAGGSHVATLAVQECSDGIYYQEPLSGRAISAAFVADGARTLVLGFSEQWTAPKAGSPWRYGGAVMPADIGPGRTEEMTDAVVRICGAFGLKGLGSADFIVSAEGAKLLEINPRPGATLDLFDRGEPPLLGVHVAAVGDGRLPDMAPRLDGACAAATVFAPAPLTVRQGVIWPDWIVDRPYGGERIDKDRPICTVLAQAGTAGAAKRLAEERRDRAAFNVLTANAA